MGAIAESESLLRRVVPDDQGFNPEDPDAQKVHYRIKYSKGNAKQNFYYVQYSTIT